MNSSYEGYQDVKEIYRSARTVVYRARRADDQTPVILKVHRDEYPSPDEVGSFQREWRLGKQLRHIEGVIPALGLERIGRKLMLVYEDFGGESIKHWIKQRRLTLDEFLHIGIQVTQALAEVHAARVIHKDLNPANIVFRPASCDCRIIDFGISTHLPQQASYIMPSPYFVGTPPYVSPEQTGRINWTVDYRTDFYSLGITLYEMITGKRPFISDDAERLILYHIAKQAVAPHEVNPAIPAVISQIVMKLMAKSPEERYQSALGIRRDFEICLDHLLTRGTVQPFPIAQSDWPDRITLPQKLYGRKAELDTLIRTFNRVGAGGHEVLVIGGPAGIGKSTLVQQIFKQVTLQHGHFISGKFEKIASERPYLALVHAFQSLVQHLLSEPEQKMVEWRSALLQSFGPSGRLLVDLIPELQLLVGPQPALPHLGLDEGQNRFDEVFRNFVRVLAKPETPLVIFLDELQWADQASLHLLELLIESRSLDGLFLICAYRDDTVGPAHPLPGLFARLEQRGIAVERMQLAPLDLNELTELLGDVLHCSREVVLDLARMMAEKTGGNPLLLNEFLRSLQEEGVLQFDRELGVWQWDPLAVQAHHISENLAQCMAERIKKTDHATQQVLKYASCLGGQFSLSTLALACEKSVNQVAEFLQPAINEGWLIPLGEMVRPRLAEQGLSQSYALIQPSMEFKFSHDRVHQAADSLIEPAERADLRWKIGWVLLRSLPEDARDKQIFDIADHLNTAPNRVEDEQDRRLLVETNLKAGIKASRAGAHAQAIHYLTQAKALMGSAGWANSHEQWLQLTLEAAQAAYLHHDFARVEHWTEEILVNARSPEDRCAARQIRILTYATQYQHQRAIRESLMAMRDLGVEFPEDPGRWQVIWSYLRVRLAMGRKTASALVNRPEMVDRHLIALIGLMRSVAISTYLSNPRLTALLVFEQIRLLLRHGHNNWSSSAFTSFSMLLGGPLRDLDTAWRASQVAMQLLEKGTEVQNRARVIFGINALCRHWKESLDNCQEPLRQGFAVGLETGDFEYGSLCLNIHAQHRFYLGHPLAEIDIQLREDDLTIQPLKVVSAHNYNLMFLLAVHQLQGKSSKITEPDGQILDAQILHTRLERAHDRTGLCGYFYLKAWTAFLLKHREEALAMIESAYQLRHNVTGLFGYTRLHFLWALCQLTLCAHSRGRERRRILGKVRAVIRRFCKWADHCPANHRHLQYLLQAEYLRANGQTARELYDRCIEAACKNGFYSEEALAKALAGEHFLHLGLFSIARIYLKDAHYAYLCWGAAAIQKNIEEHYPQIESAARG